jgi:PAS domain S-box-containing protein
MIVMGWQYNHAALPLLGASIVGVSLSAVLWQRRRQEGAVPLMVLLLAAAIWSFAEAGELGSIALGTKVLWSKVRFLGIVTIPFTWVVFALHFSHNRHLITRRNLALLAILPIVNLALVWTNEWHRLIWRTEWLHRAGSLTVMGTTRGGWYVVLVSWAYVSILLGAFLLFRAAIRSHRRYRSQTALLLCGVLSPLIVNVIFQLRLNPIPYQDLTPMSFTFAGLVLTWDFLRHGLLFPPMPVARDQVVQSMRDGVVVLDLDNRILDLNQAAQDMLSDDPESLLGRSLSDFVDSSEGTGASSNTPASAAMVLQRAGAHTRHLEVSFSPLSTKWAGPVGNVAILRDVTERKLADLQYQRLFTAIEHTAEEIVITSRTGTIVYVNPAFERNTGYAREEAVGQNPRFLKSGVHDEAFYRDMWKALGEGRVWQGTLTNRRKDGTHIQQEATISPILDGDGAVVGHVAVERDVTEQLRLQGMLRRSQKMEAVGQLAGGIAHDFNNLLVPIIGYADLLQATMEPSDSRRDDLSEVLEAAKRARRLTRQLLAFSKRQVLEMGPVDINDAVCDLAAMLRRTTREDIDFDLLLAPRLQTVWADVSQIEQVLMNLVVNSQDAMPKGGGLTIRTANVDAGDIHPHGDARVQPGSYVMLAVSDTGTGISDDVLEHVFEPFFTTKEEKGGTGLGLATVYGIVQQHEGAISIGGTQGEGTTVAVYFPVMEAATGARPSRHTAIPRENPPIEDERVLVVEDDTMVLRVVCALLKEQGYQVRSFSDGRECLEAVERGVDSASLLITDVIMPHMNGRDLHERLKARLPGLRVLYMSGYADDVIDEAALAGDGAGFIQKPFSVVELREKLRVVTGRQG